LDKLSRYDAYSVKAEVSFHIKQIGAFDQNADVGFFDIEVGGLAEDEPHHTSGQRFSVDHCTVKANKPVSHAPVTSVYG